MKRPELLVVPKFWRSAPIRPNFIIKMEDSGVDHRDRRRVECYGIRVNRGCTNLCELSTGVRACLGEFTKRGLRTGADVLPTHRHHPI